MEEGRETSNPAGGGTAEAGSRRASFVVTGMDCSECAMKVDRAVGRLHGVERVSTTFASSRMAITYNPLAVSEEVIREQVRGLGFGIHDTHEDAQAHGAVQPPTRALSILVAGAFLLLGWAVERAGLPTVMGHHGLVQIGRALYAVSICIGGFSVFRSAWASVRTGLIGDINVLMSVAVIGAIGLGKWDEGAVVLFLYALGQWLEMYTIDRTRGSVRSLMSLAPPTARVVTDAAETELPSATVSVGSLIRIRSGESVPLDGVVETGASAVNESSVTGESYPVEKRPGDLVYAGTMNGNGLLDVRTTETEAGSAIARIADIVQEAQARKAPMERFVDRFSRWYTPSVMALAFFVAMVMPVILHEPFRDWIYRALILLVASCPCALVISTPVAIVSALGNAARKGILIKGGAALEAAGTITTVAFDKTGTLTEGQPSVAAVVAAPEVDPNALAGLAAGLEAHSIHPLAEAIRRYAQERQLAVPTVEETRAVPGKGIAGNVNGAAFWIGSLDSVLEGRALPDPLEESARTLEAEGKTVLCVSEGTRPLGLIAVSDKVRPDASAAIASLKRHGVSRVVLLTGDSQHAANAVAAELGLITHVQAGLMPEAKRDAVEALVLQGGVAMVGDGVNDAPALATATVGIAMGAIGSDVAIEAADIALMGDDLGHVAEALALSRRTMAVIRQNVAFALAIKLAFLVGVLAGVTTLWMAVAADTGASVMVTLNAMRLMNGRSTKAAN